MRMPSKVIFALLLDLWLEVMGLGDLSSVAEYLTVRESLLSKDLSDLIHLWSETPCLVIQIATLHGVLTYLASDLTSVVSIRTLSD